MHNPSPRRWLLSTAMAALTLFSLPDARGAQRTIGTSGANTGYSGQHNMIYKPGIGYWAFFKATNADRVVWRYSPDGLTWSATDESGNKVTQADVFPFLQIAPNASWGNPSIAYASSKNRVYVVANDAASDTPGGGSTVDGAQGDATGNKVFIRWGTLNNNGSITWSSIKPQPITIRIRTGNGGPECQIATNNNNVTYDPRSQRSAVIAYSSSTAEEYVSVAVDANGSTGFGMGALALTNLTPDVTD